MTVWFICILWKAITNTEFNCLSEEKKKELKEFSDFLK